MLLLSFKLVLQLFWVLQLVVQLVVVMQLVVIIVPRNLDRMHSTVLFVNRNNIVLPRLALAVGLFEPIPVVPARVPVAGLF